MKLGLFRLCAAVALLCPAVWAQAAITCTVSSPGFITSYDPAAASQTIVQSYLTVTCQRNAAGDGYTQSYSVEADTATTARLGANTVNYNLSRDSLCNSAWTTNNTRRLPNPAPGTMTLSGYIPTSVNISYWACLPAGQPGRPAGTYTDTTTMTLFSGTSNAAVLATGTFPVSILMSATCSISTAPGAITFNYVSFGPAANASTTFGATCTSTLPYTLALDATSGTMLGLNYSLALSAAGGTGTGVAQTYTISGTMAAGQAGTCAVGTCSASQARTLTITY